MEQIAATGVSTVGIDPSNPTNIMKSTHLQSSFCGVILLAAALLFPLSLRADESGPAFHHDFEKASEAAKETKKPLLVVFSASWCPPCQQMKKQVYPSKEVQPYHDQFVWAYLDADEDKNKPLAAEFGVSGIPHIAFLREDGSMLGHFAGAVAPDQFTEILDKVLADKEAPKTAAAE
ncbi:thioredoxin family protein [Verrucomicrobiales bacterium BCK34]|nr:thioredoxin family protein [Verrucomicrobiales bacterium BCK34]